jgi:hypothetical protein
MSQRCRSCNAPIKWAYTIKGKRIPLDPNPSPEGNIELINGIAEVVGPSDNPADIRHISHFATCPNANKHRRKKL